MVSRVMSRPTCTHVLSDAGAGYASSVPAFLTEQIRTVESQSMLSGSKFTSTAILLAIPCLFTWQGIGINFAKNRDPNIFPLTPVITASVVNLLGFVAAHLVRYEVKALGAMFNRGYLIPGIATGALNGVWFVLKTLAVVRVPTSVAFVIGKTSILWTLLGEAAQQKALPSGMHALISATLVLSCAGYSASAPGVMSDITTTDNIIGVVCALGAALFAASSDIVNATGSSRLKAAVGEGADPLETTHRWLIVLEVAKLCSLSVVFAVMNGADVAEKGFFVGWDPVSAVIMMLPYLLTPMACNLSIPAFGPLVFNVVLALDVALSYSMEVCLAYTKISVTGISLVMSITLLIVGHCFLDPSRKAYLRAWLQDRHVELAKETEVRLPSIEDTAQVVGAQSAEVRGADEVLP